MCTTGFSISLRANNQISRSSFLAEKMSRSTPHTSSWEGKSRLSEIVWTKWSNLRVCALWKCPKRRVYSGWYFPGKLASEVKLFRSGSTGRVGTSSSWAWWKYSDNVIGDRFACARSNRFTWSILSLGQLFVTLLLPFAALVRLSVQLRRRFDVVGQAQIPYLEVQIDKHQRKRKENEDRVILLGNHTVRYYTSTSNDPSHMIEGWCMKICMYELAGSCELVIMYPVLCWYCWTGGVVIRFLLGFCLLNFDQSKCYQTDYGYKTRRRSSVIRSWFHSIPMIQFILIQEIKKNTDPVQHQSWECVFLVREEKRLFKEIRNGRKLHNK